MGHYFDGESAIDLQEVLEMRTRIFMCLSTKLVCLHHVDEGWLELKSIVSNIDCWSSMNVGCSWSREFTKNPLSIWLSSDSKAETFLSLALVLLSNASESST